MKNSKYKEIFKLADMLTEAGIPFVFTDRSATLRNELCLELYQICYPNDNHDRIVSVIEGSGTYGEDEDKLEIMGLLTSEEAEHDVVAGYLTATDVFERIRTNFYERGEN